MRLDGQTRLDGQDEFALQISCMTPFNIMSVFYYQGCVITIIGYDMNCNKA